MARRKQVVRGLNFASGASGIRRETGTFSRRGGDNEEHIQGNTTKLATHLSKCIYYSGMGSNDYLNNYFMPFFYPTSYFYNPEVFAELLLQDYSQQLRELYDLGARKVAVFSVGRIGCIPYELARYNNRNYDSNGDRCNEEINEAISIFNAGLVRMVTEFNAALHGAKFVYVNTYDSLKDLTTNAISYGFSVINRGCCGVGRNNGQITCLPLQNPCGDRSKYLFWDAFHPTEAGNLIYAMKAYNSTSTADVYPMNLRQLAAA
uniref:GDSL esterase/lipase n=1 Tax=Ananas comosus var. bracteatus TaxID=296719 RepID=A0A6V7P190_ANACO|nr:unnamed protein product [Ananas comosus var. bracteatus]